VQKAESLKANFYGKNKEQALSPQRNYGRVIEWILMAREKKMRSPTPEDQRK
jgi:hypothetical protein